MRIAGLALILSASVALLQGCGRAEVEPVAPPGVPNTSPVTESRPASEDPSLLLTEDELTRYLAVLRKQVSERPRGSAKSQWWQNEIGEADFETARANGFDDQAYLETMRKVWGAWALLYGLKLGEKLGTPLPPEEIERVKNSSGLARSDIDLVDRLYDEITGLIEPWLEPLPSTQPTAP